MAEDQRTLEEHLAKLNQYARKSGSTDEADSDSDSDVSIVEAGDAPGPEPGRKKEPEPSTSTHESPDSGGEDGIGDADALQALEAAADAERLLPPVATPSDEQPFIVGPDDIFHDEDTGTSFILSEESNLVQGEGGLAAPSAEATAYSVLLNTSSSAATPFGDIEFSDASGSLYEPIGKSH